MKNKLFFFFDYDGQRNTSPIPCFCRSRAPSDALSQQAFQLLQPYLAPIPKQLNNNVYLGKVDLVPQLRISGCPSATTRIVSPA